MLRTKGGVLMYKKILVPTDASEYSRSALRTAIKLAKMFDAEIVLLHVTFSPHAYWGYTVSYGISVTAEELTQNGKIALETTLAGIPLEETKLRTVLESGHPVNKILEKIQDENIDLVVIGSHGYGPITGPLLGSVSQRVLQKAPCPVLLVK
jgi:nucleotide-binding universal stress UspA family protein